MSDFPQVLKRLTVTPVIEGVSPKAKLSAIIGDIGSLAEYLTIPSYVTPFQNPYVRQLLFQYNYSMPHDFFILNLAQLRAYQSMIVHGGLLAVKYRVDNQVYRYILIDHRSDINWSSFAYYTNQIIKKNFCIEFWSDTLQAGQLAHYITQPFILKLSNIIIPTSISQESSYFDVPNPPLNADALGNAFPEFVPTDQSDIAWRDNIFNDNDLIEINGPDIIIVQTSEQTYRLQLFNSGNWVTIGTDGVPPQINLEGTNLRFKNNVGPQWYDSDTGLWHTLVVSDIPPRLFINPTGEV